MVGFHQPDDAAAAVAAEGLLDVVLVVGEEMRSFRGVGLRAHGDVVAPPQAGFQCGVYLGDVEITAEIEQAGFGRGSEPVRWDAGFGQGGSAHGYMQEAREAAGDGVDGGEGESVPGAEVADVPPEVGLLAVAAVEFQLGAEVYGGVRTGEVFGETEGWIVIAMILELFGDCGRSTSREGDWRRDEGGCSRLVGGCVGGGAVRWIVAVGGVAVAAESGVVDDG